MIVILLFNEIIGIRKALLHTGTRIQTGSPISAFFSSLVC